MRKWVQTEWNWPEFTQLMGVDRNPWLLAQPLIFCPHHSTQGTAPFWSLLWLSAPSLSSFPWPSRLPSAPSSHAFIFLQNPGQEFPLPGGVCWFKFSWSAHQVFYMDPLPLAYCSWQVFLTTALWRRHYHYLAHRVEIQSSLGLETRFLNIQELLPLYPQCVNR